MLITTHTSQSHRNLNLKWIHPSRPTLIANDLRWQSSISCISICTSLDTTVSCRNCVWSPEQPIAAAPKESPQYLLWYQNYCAACQVAGARQQRRRQSCAGTVPSDDDDGTELCSETTAARNANDRVYPSKSEYRTKSICGIVCSQCRSPNETSSEVFHPVGAKAFETNLSASQP